MQTLLTFKDKLIMHTPKRIWRTYWSLRRDLQYIRKSLSNWKELEKSPPNVLAFNVIGVCNANCVFCAYQFTKPEGPMGMDIYKKAIQEYREMGGKVVDLTPMVGEPLLDPFLFERIKIAKAAGLWVYLFTNGILLRGKAEKLLN